MDSGQMLDRLFRSLFEGRGAAIGWAIIGGIVGGIVESSKGQSSRLQLLKSGAENFLGIRLDSPLEILLVVAIVATVAAARLEAKDWRSGAFVGFGVFSLFGAVPSLPDAPAVGPAINASAISTPLGFIATALADQIQEGKAKITLTGEAAETEAEVLITNLTTNDLIGAFTVTQPLTITGGLGELIELVWERKGYVRTRTVVKLGKPICEYTLALQPSGAPIFLQRLLSEVDVSATVMESSSVAPSAQGGSQDPQPLPAVAEGPTVASESAGTGGSPGVGQEPTSGGGTTSSEKASDPSLGNGQGGNGSVSPATPENSTDKASTAVPGPDSESQVATNGGLAEFCEVSAEN
jgi:hypothetical protein